ncbi:MAG: YfiR family protein [Acidobacteriota bacterium]|nr:YfiR family protein [Acidobacteriota bacterium]
MVFGLTGYSDLVVGQSAQDEYQKKAQFIHNFIRFSKWPADAFSSADPRLVLGVLGEDPFGPVIDKLEGKVVNGRKIKIVRYGQAKDIETAHVLFISQSERDHLGAIFSGLEGKSVMTIGESDAFAESGGIIAFVTENDEIRFKINPDAAKAANIQIGLNLVKLGEVVRTELATREPIRLAILPILERLQRDSGSLFSIRQGFLLALETSKDFAVKHAPNRPLAKKFGAEMLKIDRLQNERIWGKAIPEYINEHPQPNVTAIAEFVEGLNVRAVLTYSIFRDDDYGGSGDYKVQRLRGILIDVETGKVYQRDDTINAMQRIPSKRVKHLTDALLRDYLNALNKSKAATPADSSPADAAGALQPSG